MTEVINCLFGTFDDFYGLVMMVLKHTDESQKASDLHVLCCLLSHAAYKEH